MSSRVRDARPAFARAAWLIVAWGVLGGYAALVSPVTGGQAPGDHRISVDVDLVVLHATVCDRRGGFVSALSESAFAVYEDGVPQRIRLFRHEDIPVTVGLVIDHSGSMKDKIAGVTAAAGTFVQSSNRLDQMFVVNFNETVTLGLPEPKRFTDSSAELERAIWRAPATGETALYDAIAEGLERLKTGSRDKKVLLVVSDGSDNKSKRSLAQVTKLAVESSAIIYAVGIFSEDDEDANPRVLERLARETGGEAFSPKELSGIAPACDRIARDIRSQYIIGYVSTNATRDGARRAIRVAAQAKGHGKLVVRTRAGYIAGAEPRPHKKNEVGK